jgi:hypothetical protein
VDFCYDEVMRMPQNQIGDAVIAGSPENDSGSEGLWFALK